MNPSAIQKREGNTPPRTSPGMAFDFPFMKQSSPMTVIIRKTGINCGFSLPRRERTA